MSTSNSSSVARWGEVLGKRYIPVSEYFLSKYHLLSPEINSTQAILLVQLSRWETAYPTVGHLSRLTNLDERTVRRNMKALEDNGYIERRQRHNKSNEYDLSPLKTRLEELFRREKQNDLAKRTRGGGQ